MFGIGCGDGVMFSCGSARRKGIQLSPCSARRRSSRRGGQLGMVDLADLSIGQVGETPTAGAARASTTPDDDPAQKSIRPKSFRTARTWPLRTRFDQGYSGLHDPRAEDDPIELDEADISASHARDQVGPEAVGDDRGDERPASRSQVRSYSSRNQSIFLLSRARQEQLEGEEPRRSRRDRLVTRVVQERAGFNFCRFPAGS